MGASSYDSGLVSTLVAGARAGGPAADPLVAWVRDATGSLDGLEPRVAFSAIEAALRTGNGAALLQARDRARDKAVRKAAAAALHRHRSSGGRVQEERAPQQWTLAAEEVAVAPPVAFLGLPDFEEYFAFFLVVAGESEIVAFGGTAGGAQGNRGAEHAHLSRSARRKILAEIRQDPELVEVPFHAALHVLERAFTAGAPHEWDHLLVHVDEGVRASARLLDPLARLAREPTLDGVSQAVPLLEGEHALRLYLEPEAVAAAAVEVEAARHSPLELSEQTRADRVEQAISEAADAVLTPTRRASMALALDVATLVADVRGWDEVRDAARHTALALKADWRGRDIPYVRELVARALGAEPV